MYLRQWRPGRGAAAVALLALLGDGAERRRGRLGDGVGGPEGHPEGREREGMEWSI